MLVSPDPTSKTQNDLRSLGEALMRIARILQEHSRKLEVAIEGTYGGQESDPRIQLLSDSLRISRNADLELERLNQAAQRLILALQEQFAQASQPLPPSTASRPLPPPPTGSFEREGDVLKTSITNLQRQRNELEALYDIARVLNSTLEFDKVLRMVMDEVLDVVKAERGFLVLVNPTTNKLEFTIARDKEKKTIGQSAFQQISLSTVEKVIRTREPVLTNDAQIDAALKADESIMAYGIRSIMCAPLVVRNNCIGAVYVDSRISANLFSDKHRDLLLTFCHQAAIAIDNARLFADLSKALRRVEEDKQYMDNILASIINGVITTDSSGIITTFNNAAGEILRLDPPSVIGKNYQEVFSTSALSGLVGLLREAISYRDQSTSARYSADVPGRGLVTLQLYISSLRDLKGAQLGAMIVVDDRTGLEADPSASSSSEQQETLVSHSGVGGSDDRKIGSNVLMPSSSTIHLRITEEPLTAQNFTTIISALNELYTKCWLIQQGRFTDLIEYTQTHSTHFTEDANLIIAQLTHSSPTIIKLDVGIKDIADALKVGIDALLQAPLRHEAMKLENEFKALEAALQKQEAQSAFEDKAQARTIEAQRAEIEKQTAELKIAQQQLELEQQKLALQRAILEAQHQRINLAFETANKIVEMLSPTSDMINKAMLVQSLLPQLLQLDNGKGLELLLPAPAHNVS